MKKILLAACAFSCATLSAQTTQTFNFTGAMQTFTVPSCVTTVTITCYGAQGGTQVTYPQGTSGMGGMAQGELSVTTGQVLNIFVGGQNGYNGGGVGGANGNTYFGGPQTGTAPNGGGGSDVRVNGTAVTDRVIVAGGGGGGGCNGTWPGCQVAGPAGDGGAGGGLTGGNGGFGVGTPCNCAGGGGDVGTGGSQVAGGIHGNYYGSTACLRSSWTAGMDGTLYQGGAGSTTYHNGTGGGGGGGGGYYGGGSGGNGSDTTPGGGGGGGSSYTGGVTNGTTTSGVQTGDGMITISYVPSPLLAPVNFSGPTAVCPATQVTFSVDPVVGATSHNWTVPNGWTITSGQGTNTVTVVVGFNSDTVWVNGAEACGNGPSSYFLITVYPLPTLDLGLAFTNCGDTTLTADPAVSYAWSTGDTTQSIPVSTSGIYSVTITDANGCTNSDYVSVTIDTIPDLDLGADTLVCTGVTLTADSSQTYLWGGGETTQAINVTSSGTYYVTISDGEGCMNSDTINVTITGNPTVVASAAMNFVCLADDSVQLFGSPGGGMFTGPGVVPVDMFDPAAAGIGTHDIVYSYTDVNGCFGMDTITITVDICLGVAINEGSGFDVYPNPASSSVTITFSADVNTGTIEITNLQGQVIKSQQVNNVSAGSQIVFDLNNIAAGTYMMNVISGESKSVRTLIIQ